MIEVKLDHIVIGVPHLEEAMDFFHTKTGAHPVFGGKHEGIGTHNALIGLNRPEDKIYLELLAIDPSSELTEYPFGLTRSMNESRIVTWAVQCHPIENVMEALKGYGAAFDFGMVLPLKRKKPSGELLEWKLTYNPEQFSLSGGTIPFLIDWGATEHPTEKMEAENFCDLQEFTVVTEFSQQLQALHLPTQEVKIVAGPFGFKLQVGKPHHHYVRLS